MKSRAKPLGLHAGWGCGVALGYGWGAGIMLKPTALESFGLAIKSKIPPSILQKIAPLHQNNIANNNSEIIQHNGMNIPGRQTGDVMGGSGGIGWNHGTTILGTTQASPNIDSATLNSSSPASTTTASLEKDVAELTKIVLRQQVTLEDVQRQLETLRSQLSQRNDTSKKR